MDTKTYWAVIKCAANWALTNGMIGHCYTVGFHLGKALSNTLTEVAFTIPAVTYLRSVLNSTCQIIQLVQAGHSKIWKNPRKPRIWMDIGLTGIYPFQTKTDCMFWGFMVWKAVYLYSHICAGVDRNIAKWHKKACSAYHLDADREITLEFTSTWQKKFWLLLEGKRPFPVPTRYYWTLKNILSWHWSKIILVTETKST